VASDVRLISHYVETGNSWINDFNGTESIFDFPLLLTNTTIATGLALESCKVLMAARCVSPALRTASTISTHFPTTS